MPLGKAVKRLAVQKLLCDLTLELNAMGSVSCHGLFSKSPANRSIQLCFPVRPKGPTPIGGPVWTPIDIEQIDAAELTPGELSARVRKCVEENGARTVVVDSLNGYQAAMPGENVLVLHMHELLQYLNRQGATTFVTIAQHGLVGDTRTPVDVTYLADTVILLRYFETRGRLRRAISVVKKRTGAHEDTIREYSIGADGVRIGEALLSFQGMARGVRSLFGDAPELIEERH